MTRFHSLGDRILKYPFLNDAYNIKSRLSPNLISLYINIFIPTDLDCAVTSV